MVYNDLLLQCHHHFSVKHYHFLIIHRFSKQQHQRQFHNRKNKWSLVRKEVKKNRGAYQSSSSFSSLSFLVSEDAEYLPMIAATTTTSNSRMFRRNFRHDLCIWNSINSIEEYNNVKSCSVDSSILTSTHHHLTTNTTDHWNSYDHDNHHITKLSEVIIDMTTEFSTMTQLEVVRRENDFSINDNHKHHKVMNTPSSNLSFGIVKHQIFKPHQQKYIFVGNNKKTIAVTKNEEVNNQTYRNGLIIIGFITLLFASNSPVIQAAYSEISSSTTSTIPVLLLNASCSIIAMITMMFANLFFSDTNSDNNNLYDIKNNPTNLYSTKAEFDPNISFINKFNMPIFMMMTSSSSYDSFNIEKVTIVDNDETIVNHVSTKTNQKSISVVNNNNSNNIVSSNILKLLSNQDQLGGIELGVWKFLGTLLNIYGLSLTSAGHGSFLIQLTTLFVPLAQGIMGVPIPKQIWIAISLALSGVFLFTTSANTDSIVSSSSLYGDIACIGAAFMYATYDLRLYHYGKHIEPLKLITGKIITQTSLSIIALLLFASTESYDFIISSITLANQHDNMLLLFVIIWSGFIVNAMKPYLQVSGQQAIGPARAQIIYATQPLWASIMSYIFLHEVMSQQGMIGSTLFLIAVLLASTAPPVVQEEVAVLVPDDFEKKKM